MSRRGTLTRRVYAAFGSGPFTVAEALSEDIGKDRISRSLRRRELVRVARGVYRLSHVRDSRLVHLDRVDALVKGRPDRALAGVSAAAAWDLPCPEPWGDWAALPRTVCSAKPIRSAPGLVRLMSTGRRIVDLDGRRVTDLADTALDVGWQLPTPQALIVMDAIGRRLAGTADRRVLASEQTRSKLRAELADRLADRPKQPGLRRQRTAAALLDPAAESPPESFIRGHLIVAGLPAPVVNPGVRGKSGRQYYVDLFWPAVNRGLEVDGASKYVGVKVLLQEKVRQEDIEATGIRLMRTMAADAYREPETVMADVRRRIFGL